MRDEKVQPRKSIYVHGLANELTTTMRFLVKNPHEKLPQPADEVD